VDNVADAGRLEQGARALGAPLGEGVASRLLELRDELLRWNRKVNLTSITAPEEVLEKHFLDSLAVLPELGNATTLLDLGAGAGFPGLPLRIARPDLSVTLVDSVGKKVAFMKHMIARLGLRPGARAVHVRAAGQPEREGLQQASVVICRAFLDVGDWLPLASHYLCEDGRALAMLGKAPPEAELQAAAAAAGLTLGSLRRYELPFSRSERAVAVFFPGSR
jgi:16S rRNA (guanine527-N7)-methyltransferase